MTLVAWRRRLTGIITLVCTILGPLMCHLDAVAAARLGFDDVAQSDDGTIYVSRRTCACVDVLAPDGSQKRLHLRIEPSSLAVTGTAIWAVDYSNSALIARIVGTTVTYVTVTLPNQTSKTPNYLIADQTGGVWTIPFFGISIGCVSANGTLKSRQIFDQPTQVGAVAEGANELLLSTPTGILRLDPEPFAMKYITKDVTGGAIAANGGLLWVQGAGNAVWVLDNGKVIAHASLGGAPQVGPLMTSWGDGVAARAGNRVFFVSPNGTAKELPVVSDDIRAMVAAKDGSLLLLVGLNLYEISRDLKVLKSISLPTYPI
jgi:hypothetical protein